MDKIHLEDLHIEDFKEKWEKLSEQFPSVKLNITPTAQQYLELMTNVADLLGIDNTNVVNYTKLEIIMVIEAMRMFTNIEFSDEELADYGKLYDKLYQCGLRDAFVYGLKGYYSNFFEGIKKQIQAIYDYNASAYGIMEGLTQKYKDTEFDVDRLNNELKDENSIPLLKEIIDKLG